MRIDLEHKLKYIIVYDDGIPIVSIPTYDKKVDKLKIISDHNLKSNVIIKLENIDKFIGW